MTSPRRLCARAAGLTLVSMLATVPALAQDELTLKKAFEGRRVVVKIDMPASSEGVDVWPGRDLPVEFPKVASRIKAYGTAIRPGESQMVTKVHLLRNKIEFQLGGGGYGTFADLLSAPSGSSAVVQGETSEEKDLKAQIKATGDANKRRDLERRLRDLQRQRNADNSLSRSEAAQADAAVSAEVRQRRLAAGSRFTIHWKDEVPAEFRTPEGIMRALGEYVDFSPMGGVAVAAAGGTAAGGETSPGAGAGIVSLRKGMTVQEVEQLLGPAKAVVTDESSGMEIATRTYDHPDHRVVAKFAAGVLVDFAITPH